MAPQQDLITPVTEMKAMITSTLNLELMKRQVTSAPNFIGYSSVSGQGWEPFWCAGSGNTLSNTYPLGSSLPGLGACCPPSTSCILPTACSGTLLLYSNEPATTCTSDSCVVIGLFSTLYNSNPVLGFACGSTDATYVLTPPTLGAAVPTTPQLASLAALITSISSSSSSSSSSSPSSSSTAETSPILPTPTPSSSSDGAKIAGAVVGPIAAVALILGLVFVFFKRRRTNDTAAVYRQTQPVQPVTGLSQPYADQVVPKAELPGNASSPNPSIPPAYQTPPSQPSAFAYAEGYGEPVPQPVQTL